MRTRPPLLSALRTTVAIIASVATVAAQDSTAVTYQNPAERAAGWALLREPLVFEGGALTALSREVAADQARTLAANEGLRVTIGITGDGAALFQDRAEALSEVFAEAGVQPAQIRFLPVDAALIGGPEATRDPTARVLLADGALTAGVLSVPYRIQAWPQAEVFILPRRLVIDDEHILCDPPFAARADPPDGDGVVTGTYPRKTVVVLSRDAERLVFRTHEMGALGPDDLLDLASLSHVSLCEAP